MPSGIEIYDPAGNLIMDGTGRYGRIIDIFQPNLGAGSKAYPGIDPDSLDFVYFQGDECALSVWKDGQSIKWNRKDSYYTGGFRGARQLIVVAF